jgi:uncharacterized protein YbaP (TraB family)
MQLNPIAGAAIPANAPIFWKSNLLGGRMLHLIGDVWFKIFAPLKHKVNW